MTFHHPLFVHLSLLLQIVLHSLVNRSQFLPAPTRNLDGKTHGSDNSEVVPACSLIGVGYTSILVKDSRVGNVEFLHLDREFTSRELGFFDGNVIFGLDIVNNNM